MMPDLRYTAIARYSIDSQSFILILLSIVTLYLGTLQSQSLCSAGSVFSSHSHSPMCIK
ncbi:hypothetical protein Hanom_Chr16g01443501 [Helianthus anomalus]